MAEHLRSIWVDSFLPFLLIPTKAPQHAGIGVSWLLNQVADIKKVHTKYVAIRKTWRASFVCSIPTHKLLSIPWIQNWPRFWKFREQRILMLHSYGIFNKVSQIGYWHTKNSGKLIMSAVARISKSFQPLLLKTWFVTSSSSVWSLFEMQGLRAHSLSTESQCGVYSVGPPLTSVHIKVWEPLCKTLRVLDILCIITDLVFVLMERKVYFRKQAITLE